ncbi:MAG TPA: cupin domain-containing protein [Polyangiales bacterium]
MTQSKDDAFLRELEELEGSSGIDALTSAAGAAPLAPVRGARARLLQAAQPKGRLWRFADQVADLLDVDLDRAHALLDSVDDLRRWEQLGPGISAYWVEGGPRVRDAVRGFVRVDAGLTFPHHEHLGDETALILQGTYLDSATGERFRPGDIARMEYGSEHAVVSPADGVDLLKLVVVFKGVRIGDHVHTARS